MFARYCAVVAVHGVGVWAPKSSFSAIHGVAQPVTETAKSKRRSARPTIVAGSVGTVGVPTRLLKLRSKKTVAAPAARASAGFSVPDVNASVSPGFCGIGASCPAKSTQSGFESGMPHSRASALPGRTRAAQTAASTTARAHAHSCSFGTGRSGKKDVVSTGSIAAKGRRAGKSPWVERLGRVGLVAKAVLYAVIGDPRDPGRARRRARRAPTRAARCARSPSSRSARGCWCCSRSASPATRSGGSRRASSTGTARAKGPKGLAKRAAALAQGRLVRRALRR